MAPLPVTISDLEGPFDVWNLSILHTSGNAACIIYNVYTWIGNRTWLV